MHENNWTLQAKLNNRLILAWMKLCTVLSCKFHYKTIYIEKINSQNICVCCPIRLRIIDYYWTLEFYYIILIDTIVLYFEFCVSEKLCAPAWFYLITHWLQKNSCINYCLITICVTKSNSHVKYQSPLIAFLTKIMNYLENECLGSKGSSILLNIVLF